MSRDTQSMHKVELIGWELGCLRIYVNLMIYFRDVGISLTKSTVHAWIQSTWFLFSSASKMLPSLEMTEVMIRNNALFGKVEFFNPFLHLLLYNDFKRNLVRFHAGKKNSYYLYIFLNVNLLSTCVYTTTLNINYI